MADPKKTTEEVTGSKVTTTPTEKKGIGMEPNVIRLLCYLFTPLSSFIFMLTEKESPEWEKIKFDVMQSLYFGIAAMVIHVAISWILCGIPSIVIIVYQIFLAVKAYQGEEVKIPVISGMVK